MTTDRTLHWDGCRNVRDLGHLPAADGRATRWGALIRGDDPTRLTQEGWQALLDHGVRTIISLRTRGKTEYNFDPALVPPDVTLLSECIEDLADLNFKAQWVDTGLWCTPLYYRDALQRWPKAHANVVRHFATAPHQHQPQSTALRAFCIPKAYNTINYKHSNHIESRRV